MATRTWQSSGSTDMNLATNYSGAGALLITDDLVFDTNSIPATATNNLNVKSVSITANYTVAWSILGYTLTVSSGFADLAVNILANAHNYGNGITLTGDGNFQANVSFVYATTCVVDLQGTGNFESTTGIQFYNVKLAYTGKTTTVTAASIASVGLQNILTINGGSLVLNQRLVIYVRTQTDPLVIVGTPSISGPQYLVFDHLGTTDFAMNFPAYTATHVLPLLFFSGAAHIFTVNLQGAISTPGLEIWGGLAGGSVVLNTNNYTIALTNVLETTSVASSASTLNAGSSTITFGSFTNLTATGTNTLNWQTSNVTCSGSWTHYKGVTVNPGTSTITFSGTGTLTSLGMPFYSFVVNAPGNTLTLGDDVFCNTYTVTAGSVTTQNFYVYLLSAGTTNIWSAAADGNWNVPTNWSLGHAPTSTEDAVFTAASIKNLTINISPTVANIGFSGVYTGTVTWAGQTITTLGTFSDYGPGAKNYGNGVNLNGTNDNMVISVNAGTVTGTSCALICNGTGESYWDSKGVTLMTLTVSANCGLSLPATTGVTSAFSNSTTPLIMGSNATLYFGRSFRFVLTGSSTFYSLGTGYSITGAGATPGQFMIGANNVAAQLPALTSSGVSITTSEIGSYTGWSFQWTGAMLLSVGALGINQSQSNGSTSLFDFNNQNISCTTFTVTRTGGTSVMTVNFGSGTFNIQAFSSGASTGCIMNFQSCTINSIGVTWTQSASNTVNAGTSQVNFTGNTTLTSVNQPFYNLTINTGVIVTVVDSVTIANGGTFTNNSNSVSLNPTTSTTLLNFLGSHTFNGTGAISIGGATASLTITLSALTYTGTGAWTISPAATSNVTFSGACSIAGPGLSLSQGNNITFSSSLTFTGNNASLTIASGLASVPAAACALTVNGTNFTLADAKGVQFLSLTLGASASMTNTGAGTTIFRINTGKTGIPLTMGNNSTLTATTQLYFSRQVAGDFVSCGTGTVANGAGAINFTINSAGVACTMAAFTASGAGALNFSNSAMGAVSWSIQFTGTQNYGARPCGIYPTDMNAFGTIDFNNQNLTCGTIAIANAGPLTGGSFTINYGSGTMNVTTYTGNGSCAPSVNFQSSQWFCAGSWTFGTTHTIDPGTSTVTITSPGGQLYTYTKPFYNLTLNAPVTLIDQIVINNGGHLTVNNSLSINPIGSGSVFNFIGTYTFDGTGDISIGGATASLTITVPTFVYGGSGNWFVAPAATSTTVFSGPVTLPGNFSATSGNLTFSDNWTMNGASANMTLGSGLGTVSVTVCDLTLNGTTGMTFSDSRGSTFESLTLGANAKVTFNGAASTVLLKSLNPALVLGANATLTHNAVTIALRVNGGGNLMTLGSGYVINGSGSWQFSTQGVGNVNMPAFNYTGTGAITFFEINPGNAINFTGAQVYGDRSCTMTTLSGANTLTINFNGYDFTCGAFIPGATSGAGSLTLNYGNSGISVATYNAVTLNSTNTYENFQTSRWSCSRNWTNSSVHQINNGTSAITFVGDSTITSYGRPFYNVFFNGPARTFTLVGSMFTNSYSLIAGTINLNGYYIYQAATANRWIATSDSSWTGSTNWSSGHAPLSSEDILFSNVSSGRNCTVDTTLTVNNWGLSNDYTGNVTLSGQTLIVNGAFSDYGSGTRHYGSSINVAGNTGSLTFGLSLGTVTSSTADLTFSGTTGMYLNDLKAVTFKSLILQPNAVLSLGTPAGSYTSLVGPAGSIPLTLNSGSKLTTNSGGGFSCGFNNTATAWSIASDATWIAGGAGGAIHYFNNNSVGGVLTVPGVTFTGGSNVTLVLRHQTNYNTTNLAGNLNLGAAAFQPYNQSADDCTFNTNGYRISCGALNSGNGTAGKSFTINYGSSDVTCSTFSSSWSVGTCNYNLQSARFYVTGTWVDSSNWNFNPGTSTITFLGAGAITTQGQPFYNAVWNASGNAYILDRLTIADGGSITATTAVNFANFADGTVLNFLGAYTFSGNGGIFVGNMGVGNSVYSGFTYTGTGGLTFSSNAAATQTFTGPIVWGGNVTLANSTFNFNSSLTMTGANTTLVLGSNMTALNATACDVTMANTGIIINDAKASTFRSLTLLADASVTNNTSTQSTTFQGTSVPLNLGARSKLSLFKSIILNVQAFVNGVTQTAYTAASDATLILNAAAPSIRTIYDGTVLLPALNVTVGSGTPQLDIGGQTFNTVMNVTGNLSLGNSQIFGRGSVPGKFTTLNFSSGGNYTHTMGELSLGSNTAGNIINYNFGGSTFNISAFTDNTYVGGTCNINLQNSTINCTGNWADSSLQNIDAGTSSVSFTGTTLSLVTSATRPFYDVTCNKTATSDMTFTDAVSLHSLNVAPTNAKGVYFVGPLTASGDIVIAGTGTVNLSTVNANGATGTVAFRSTIGYPVSVGQTINMNGTTGMTFDDDKGLTFGRLILGASAVVTNISSASTAFNLNTTQPNLVMGNNSTLTSNGPLRILQQQNNSDCYSIGTGCTLNGSGDTTFGVNNNSITVQYPALTYTGTGSISIKDSAGPRSGSVVKFTGPINLGSSGTAIMGSTLTPASITYNFNGQDLTCGTLLLGGTGSLNTYNFTTSGISCGSVNVQSDSTGTTMNFQGSRWYISGNWTYGSNFVPVPDTTDSITFTSAGTHSVTGNAKTFPKCIVNASTAWH